MEVEVFGLDVLELPMQPTDLILEAADLIDLVVDVLPNELFRSTFSLREAAVRLESKDSVVPGLFATKLRLFLLAANEGFLAAVTLGLEDAIDSSNCEDERPASGDTGAIFVDGIVESLFVPTRDVTDDLSSSRLPTAEREEEYVPVD